MLSHFCNNTIYISTTHGERSVTVTDFPIRKCNDRLIETSRDFQPPVTNGHLPREGIFPFQPDTRGRKDLGTKHLQE